MPLKDIDGGLTFQGYNPHIFTGRLPVEQYTSKPFYFGGAQAPTDLGLAPRSYSGTGMTTCGCKMRVVKKLPSIRK